MESKSKRWTFKKRIIFRLVMCLCFGLFFGMLQFPYAQDAPVIKVITVDDVTRNASAVGITPASIRAHHLALYRIATRAEGLDAGIRMNAAGKAAADYLLAAYKKAGLQKVRFEEFYPNRWWPEKYEAILLGGDEKKDEKLKAFPLWHCEKADNLELEVVYAGFGTSGEFRGLDVEGKAVLIDMKRILHFIASYRYTKALERAKDKGALAVIVAETRIASPSGNPVGSCGKIKDQKGQEPELFPLPVFSIGKADGLKIKERLEQGTTKVKLTLQYSLAQAKAVNVVGELPGNGSIDEYVIVGGHYDTWFDGAIDNLGSQASILEMAKYFAKIPQEKRQRNIIFVSMFGHEFENEAMGQAAFVEKHADIHDKITCFLDIDGSGSWGYEEKDDTGTILPTGMDDKAGIFTTSIALTAIAREAVFGLAKGPWGQYPLNSFVADIGGPIGDAGFSNMLIISKHIYYHSRLDTLDRITPDQVYRRTLMNLRIIQGLLDSPAGYLIGVNTNPSRKFKEGEEAKPDLPREAVPHNPDPWIDGPPTDLSMHIIPEKPRLFSPVIVWPTFWKADDVIMSDHISWKLGALGCTTKKIATGTIFIIPGTKTITLSVTDRKGRTTSVQREIEVTW
jgi:hypothetical protein